MSRHAQRRDPYPPPGVQAAREAEQETRRCGLCDQPSDKPLCHKCDHLLSVERFGPLQGRKL